MSFESSIKSCNKVSSCFHLGLQALGPNSRYVNAHNPRLLGGSIDLDECLKSLEPNANRWDYIIAYNEVSYCLEIHPATDGEVKTILKKAAWLNNFLQTNIPTLNKKPYHWIASGKIGILPTSRKAKILAQNGITFPKSRLDLK